MHLKIAVLLLLAVSLTSAQYVSSDQMRQFRQKYRDTVLLYLFPDDVRARDTVRGLLEAGDVASCTRGLDIVLDALRQKSVNLYNQARAYSSQWLCEQTSSRQ